MTLASRLYGRMALFRRAWYERHPDRVKHLSRPVISVGNLTVGGSGKTPIVAALAQLLMEHGERPAILSRGYGRRHAGDGVLVVSDGGQVLASTEQSGDEPQMLARALPGVAVVVGADRYLAGTLAERRFGCTVHLLDDGFQHVQLARDVDLLAVSRADLQEHVLPAGRLREPAEAAARADALLVAGDDADAGFISEALRPPAMFRVGVHHDEARLIHPFGDALPATAGRRVVAVAAIARPERFFAAVRAHGWEIAREIAFRDHHWFTDRDLQAISNTAGEAGAPLVMTTEKDAMRLQGEPRDGVPAAPARWGGVARPAGLVWAYLPMHVTIEPMDRFAAWLQERLAA